MWNQMNISLPCLFEISLKGFSISYCFVTPHKLECKENPMQPILCWAYHLHNYCSNNSHGLLLHVISFTSSENPVLAKITVAAATDKQLQWQTILVPRHTSQLKISLHKQSALKNDIFWKMLLQSYWCWPGRIVLMKIQIQPPQNETGISEFTISRSSDSSLFKFSKIQFRQKGLMLIFRQVYTYACICSYM